MNVGPGGPPECLVGHVHCKIMRREGDRDGKGVIVQERLSTVGIVVVGREIEGGRTQKKKKVSGQRVSRYKGIPGVHQG